MTSSEYPQADTYSHDILQELYRSSKYNGIAFSNVTIAAPEHVSAHDPGIAIDHRVITTTWPGGSPSGNGYESLRCGKDPDGRTPADETLLQRIALLGGNHRR